MTAAFTFTVYSWCLSVLAILPSWRSGDSALPADSKDPNTDHGDVPVSKHVYVVGGPSSDDLGAHKPLEHNSPLATSRRKTQIDDVQRTGFSESPTPLRPGTLTPTCTKKMHHRLRPQLFSKMLTIFRHKASGGVSIINSPNELEIRTDILPDLTHQLSRTSEYATSFGGLSDIWKCNLEKNRSVVAVAVKSIRSQVANAEETKKKNRRLRRELKVWSRLEHDNIVPLYGTAYGFGPFAALVCPWYEKGSLSSYLESDGETLSMVDRFKLLSEISAGLQYLHNCPIVHGDLTGSNVLISSDGVAHLSDFGLSVVVVELVATSYFTSALSGTVRWIAPELLTVPEESINVIPTTSSDIYSFGCLMFQVLTGKPPYSEYKRDAQVVVAISLGKKPFRPTHPAIVDHHWDFIQNSWSTEECRPSAKEVDAYINGELHILQHGSSSPN